MPFSLYLIKTTYSISATLSQSEYKPYKKIYYYHRRDHLKIIEYIILFFLIHSYIEKIFILFMFNQKYSISVNQIKP